MLSKTFFALSILHMSAKRGLLNSTAAVWHSPFSTSTSHLIAFCVIECAPRRRRRAWKALSKWVPCPVSTCDCQNVHRAMVMMTWEHEWHCVFQLKNVFKRALSRWNHFCKSCAVQMDCNGMSWSISVLWLKANPYYFYLFGIGRRVELQLQSEDVTTSVKLYTSQS